MEGMRIEVMVLRRGRKVNQMGILITIHRADRQAPLAEATALEEDKCSVIPLWEVINLAEYDHTTCPFGIVRYSIDAGMNKKSFP